MRLVGFARSRPQWFLVFAAMVIALGNDCAFFGEAVEPGVAEAQGGNHSDEQHHPGVAHLTSCEGAALAASSVSPIGPDPVALSSRLVATLEPLRTHVGRVARLPVPTSSPPLFLLHSALLI